MTTTAHTHSVHETSDALPYFGPVSTEQNQAAHGGVRYRETCECGAQRHKLVNGRHVEIGEWTDGDA